MAFNFSNSWFVPGCYLFKVEYLYADIDVFNDTGENQPGDIKKKKSCEILKKMLQCFLSQQIWFYLNRSAGTREACPLPFWSLQDWTSWYSIIWEGSSTSKPPTPPWEELHWVLFKLLSWWGWAVSPHFTEPAKGKGAEDSLPFAT